MARVTVEDCLEKVDNRFSLVHLVAKRSKQLIRGESPVIKAKNNKQVVTALREVAAGKTLFSAGQWETTSQGEVEKALNHHED